MMGGSDISECQISDAESDLFNTNQKPFRFRAAGCQFDRSEHGAIKSEAQL